ncbi:MAG: hypothetical protein FWC15_08960, partial [Fibromonadales bacterium]|nr:hypothetical protein [Fibromonadales bacterium]
MKTNRFLVAAGLALALLCISAHAQLGDNHPLAEQLKRADSLSAKRIPSPLAPVVTVEEAQRRWGSAPTPRPPSGNP